MKNFIDNGCRRFVFGVLILSVVVVLINVSFLWVVFVGCYFKD